MSEHLIKALENQRNAAMNEAAVHQARAAQFEQIAKDLQGQVDALNGQINKANSPPAEIVEEAKATIKRKRKNRGTVTGVIMDPPKEHANGVDQHA